MRSSCIQNVTMFAFNEHYLLEVVLWVQLQDKRFLILSNIYAYLSIQVSCDHINFHPNVQPQYRRFTYIYLLPANLFLSWINPI